MANCRLVNKTWQDCIENDKTIWHRIIAKKLIYEANSDSWKHVLDKIPFEIVKEIGEGVIYMMIEDDIEEDNFGPWSLLLDMAMLKSAGSSW